MQKERVGRVAWCKWMWSEGVYGRVPCAGTLSAHRPGMGHVSSGRRFVPRIFGVRMCKLHAHRKWSACEAI